MFQRCLTCGELFDVPLRHGPGRARLHCESCRPRRLIHPEDDSDVVMSVAAHAYLHRLDAWFALASWEAIAAKRDALLTLEDEAASDHDRRE